MSLAAAARPTDRSTGRSTGRPRLRPLRPTCPEPLAIGPQAWHELSAVVEAPTLDVRLEQGEIDPQRTRTLDLPDASRHARAFAQALVEVLTAHRPAGQLGRSTTNEIAATIGRLSARPGTSRGRVPQVRSVHVAHPSDGVAEVAATAVIGNRVHAMAFRMTGRDRRWVVDRLQVG